MLPGRSLCVEAITRPESPTECGVSEYNRETSIMRKPWLSRGCSAIKKNYAYRRIVYCVTCPTGLGQHPVLIKHITISAARVINIHTEWDNNITFIQMTIFKPLTFSQCKNPTVTQSQKSKIFQRTAVARVTGRSAEKQLTPHICIVSGMGQNFRFSALFGFQNCR